MLSKKEALKKTTQAIRDCNRLDRSEYAVRVLPPLDVAVKAKKLSEARLTIKQRAKAAVKAVSKEKLSKMVINYDQWNRRCNNGMHQNIYNPIESQYNYMMPFVDGEAIDTLPLQYPPLEVALSAEGNAHKFIRSDASSHLYPPSPCENLNTETHIFTLQNKVYPLHRQNELHFHPMLYN